MSKLQLNGIKYEPFRNERGFCIRLMPTEGTSKGQISVARAMASKLPNVVWVDVVGESKWGRRNRCGS